MPRPPCGMGVPWLGLPPMLVLIAAALGCQTIRSAPPVRDVFASLARQGGFVGPYDTWQEAVRAASKGRDWKTVAQEESCCYIITEDESGTMAARMPLKGGETLLDAVSYVPCCPGPSQADFWIVRSSVDAAQPEYVLGVDFEGITRGSISATNYPLIRGDRVLIAKKAEPCGGNNCMCRKWEAPKPSWKWW